METVYLSLGSNMGDRMAHLRAAVDHLKVFLEEMKLSSVYETAAVEMVDQASFLNMVVKGKTRCSPRELLDLLLAHEKARGRERTVPKGPRVIDLDILFYGQRVIQEPGLLVPHPAWSRRRFVVEPLHELGPDFESPDGSRLAEVQRNLETSGQEILRVGVL